MAQKTLGELIPEDAKTPSLPDWAKVLTPRQFAFLQEYQVDMNARQAAMRAGLSETLNGCSSVAKNMLREPQVQRALGMMLAEGLEARAALKRRIMEELSVLAFYDVTDFVRLNRDTVVFTDTDELTEDQRRAIKRIKETTGKTESIEVEFHDKIRALDLLDRMNGGGPKGNSGSGAEVTVPIQVNIDQRNASVA